MLGQEKYLPNITTSDFLPTGPTPNQIELRWNLLIHGSGRNTNQVPIEIGGRSHNLPPSLVHSKQFGRELELLFDVKAPVSL